MKVVFILVTMFLSTGCQTRGYNADFKNNNQSNLKKIVEIDIGPHSIRRTKFFPGNSRFVLFTTAAAHIGIADIELKTASVFEHPRPPVPVSKNPKFEPGGTSIAFDATKSIAYVGKVGGLRVFSIAEKKYLADIDLIASPSQNAGTRFLSRPSRSVLGNRMSLPLPIAVANLFAF